LLLEDAILPQVVDGGVLMTIDPAGPCGEQHLPWLEDPCYPPSLRRARDRGKQQLLWIDAYNRRCASVD
jgi:hypothetical protein